MSEPKTPYLSLKEWFDTHREPYPWGEDYSPYKVWISEIMLQQTVRTAVIPYFQRWMEAFPSVDVLAQQEEQEVVRFWEGLGYYSRARNILKASRMIRDNNLGFPDTYQGLIALPGIGDYTASAVMSIAYNQPFLVLDANVKRIFQRLLSLPQWTGEGESQTRQLFARWSREGEPRFWSEALMQLGQQVCTPRNTQCFSCPLKAFCGACKEGRVGEIPQPKSRKITILKTAVLVLFHEDKLFMAPPQGRRFQGMRIFPGAPLAESGSLIKPQWEPLGDLRERTHTYTKYKDLLYPSLYRSPEENPPAGWQGDWIPITRLEGFPMPSVYRKILEEALAAINQYAETDS